MPRTEFLESSTTRHFIQSTARKEPQARKAGSSRESPENGGLNFLTVWEMIQEKGRAVVERGESKMPAAAAPAPGSPWHQPPLLHLGMGELSLERKKGSVAATAATVHKAGWGQPQWY